jgi:hypothetical protein
MCDDKNENSVAGSAGQAPVAYEVSTDGGIVYRYCRREDVADEERLRDDGNPDVRVRPLYAAPVSSVDFSLAQKAEIARAMESGSANAVINAVIASLPTAPSLTTDAGAVLTDEQIIALCKGHFAKCYVDATPSAWIALARALLAAQGEKS